MRDWTHRLLHCILAAGLAAGLGASMAKAQAAAEYAIGTSKVASGAASFGNMLGRSESKAAEKLADTLKTKTTLHESPEQVMKENRVALEKSAGDGGGTLHLTSDPNDAAVFIDGKLAARTPSDIKLSPGKHKIMVSRPDRDQWSYEVTVTKGKTENVNAKLVNTNPSVISLDFSNPKK